MQFFINAPVPTLLGRLVETVMCFLVVLLLKVIHFPKRLNVLILDHTVIVAEQQTIRLYLLLKMLPHQLYNVEVPLFVVKAVGIPGSLSYPGIVLQYKYLQLQVKLHDALYHPSTAFVGKTGKDGG